LTSPPTKPPLVRFTALQSVVSDQLVGVSVDPPSPSREPFPTFPPRLSPAAVRRLLAQTVSSPRELHASSEYFPSQTCSAHLRVELLPWGQHSLFATSVGCVSASGFHTRTAFPSSTFLTSSTACSASDLADVFQPAATSRVHSSGVSPPAQPRDLFGDACPLVVDLTSLPTTSVCTTTRDLALRAFSSRRESVARTAGLTAARARSPLELHLLQVFLPVATRAISRPRPLVVFNRSTSSRSPA